MSERVIAERAMTAYASDSDESGAAPWPSAARRIAEARSRLGLSDVDVADRVGITIHSYYDLEAYNDEAFTVTSLAKLGELARVLGTSARFILVAEDANQPTPVITFDVISRRLSERLAQAATTPEAFGEATGWDVGGLLADPRSLAEWPVDGLYQLATALDLDWVAALPRAT